MQVVFLILSGLLLSACGGGSSSVAVDDNGAVQAASAAAGEDSAGDSDSIPIRVLRPIVIPMVMVILAVKPPLRRSTFMKKHSPREAPIAPIIATVTALR